MPRVQKEDIQRLLFNAIKSIKKLEKEKDPDKESRLRQLKEFRTKLLEFGKNTDIRLEPTNRELQRYPGIPENEDLNEYTFTTEEPKKEENVVPEETKEKRADQQEEKKETASVPVSPKVEEKKPVNQIPISTRSFAGTSTPATIVRPKVGQEQKEKIALPELQDIRRRLQRSVMAITRQAQGKEGEELDNLQRQRDKYQEAMNAAISLERQRYDEKPSLMPNDWEGVQPKTLPWKELAKLPPIDLEKLPEALKFAQQQQQSFAKEPGEVPGGKAKGQKFINADIRRVINDISTLNKDIDRLDPRVADDKKKIDSYENNIDELKKRLRYLQSIKDVGIEDRFLSDDYNNLVQQLQGYLSPEQKQAYKEGKQINLSSIGDRQGFLRTLREMGRSLDKINQSSQDEIDFLTANPTATVQEFRGMSPEERRDVLQEAKRENFMRRIASGVEDYYRERKKDKDPQYYEELAPEQQQAWLKRYAASETRKGAPGMTGADISKYLFGGGEQFVSKYPPELYNTMIRAARSGFGGMQQAAQKIGGLASQDPYTLLYGLSAPQQRHFITGAGQAPMVQQLPQEYDFNPTNLQQALQVQQQPQPLLNNALQQAPTQQETQQQMVNDLISNKLANLLQGV